MRRLQPCDAATLLVDQHRRVLAPDAGAELGDERAHLVGGDAIAPEQDQAKRIGLGEEREFGGAQPLAGATEQDRVRLI